MISRRTDLPLDGDVLAGFLPWLIAFMVFLAVVAAAGMFILHDATANWSAGLTHTLTVQVPPTKGEKALPAAEDPHVLDALKVLRTTGGIIRADLVPQTEVLELLEPWLGRDGAAGDLPLPYLIDAEADPDAKFDIATLRSRLTKAHPGISVDNHRDWLDRLVGLIDAVEWIARGVLLLIGLATVGTVIFTTRTGLSVHRDTIEVLHLIGAQDDYVAKQFAWRALTLGLRGGTIGLALAAPTVLGIGYLASGIETGLLPDASLGVAQWIALAFIPILAAAIATLTARITVTKTLAGML
ncbi:MAG: cell division protein [Rhodospirillales bacterium]|nr:cell division protein [Rhodospirillales bacterium]